MSTDQMAKSLIRQQQAHEDGLVSIAARLIAISTNGEHESEGIEQERWAEIRSLSDGLLETLSYHYRMNDLQETLIEEFMENSDGGVGHRMQVAENIRHGAEKTGKTGERVHIVLEMIDSYMMVVEDEDRVSKIKEALHSFEKEMRIVNDCSKRYEHEVNRLVGPKPPDISKMDNVVSLKDRKSAYAHDISTPGTHHDPA